MIWHESGRGCHIMKYSMIDGPEYVGNYSTFFLIRK
jgi:hypothetical protein